MPTIWFYSNAKLVAQINQNRFCSMAELSFGGDRFPQMATVDMDKVLLGLAARETSASCLPPDVSRKSG